MSTAEQIIAEHLYLGLDTADDMHCCSCGWGGAFDDFAAHVVAALTNAGKTIVELPEYPDEEMPESDDEHGYKVWKSGLGAATAHTDDTVTIDGAYHFSVSPSDVREYAGALLAAARVAEGGGQP
ncbi:hypothetical protein GS528_16465 [Rhodococcus hoagii]|nr:hypothetical protein [Prescottella equi]